MAELDGRTRLTMLPPTWAFYSGGTDRFAPLQQHRGILFPYQPDIVYSQPVNYNSYDITHTNYSVQAYRNTPNPMLQLTAQFSNVTEQEHEYMRAVIHFLRSVTKMFFGFGDVSAQAPTAGTPPPVLRFSSMGESQFKNVPVLVGNFSTTYDSTVDLKQGPGGYMPVMQTIAIDLLVQQTPDRQKKNFSMRGYKNGQLYREGFV